MPLKSERFKYGEWTGSGVGVNELIEEKELLKIYPNPAKNTLTIEGVFDKFEIFDNNGKVVISAIAAFGGKLLFDISSLESGLYYVSATKGKLTILIN